MFKFDERIKTRMENILAENKDSVTLYNNFYCCTCAGGCDGSCSGCQGPS